jgi:hypothetical protein
LVKGKVLKCRNCQQEIYFDDDVVSESGKKIPLNASANNDELGMTTSVHEYHDCPNNPYRKGKSNYETDVNLPEKNVPKVDFPLLARLGSVENTVLELVDKVAKVEAGLRGLGEALAKQSFEKASGEVV